MKAKLGLDVIYATINNNHYYTLMILRGTNRIANLTRCWTAHFSRQTRLKP
jgi:hypothetical protein